MPTLPTINVIIPTYNRKDLLRETLNSLAQQTYPNDLFEVIIIDDGSTDGTAAITADIFPFNLRYFWQKNQGDAAARNLGAQHSQADFLVFLDDDILVEDGYLAHLVQTHDADHNKIVIGTWDLWPDETTSFSRSLYGSAALGQIRDGLPMVTPLSFRDVYSNNMSLRRESYFKIGMMQGLGFPGSSIWCDLDFNYRAHKQGFEFFRSTKAVCWHRDHTVRDLDTYKKRMRTAAYRSIILFQKYPELLEHVPMFHDKTPIAWGRDSLRLIVRKLARAAISSRLVLWSMELIVHALEMYYPESTLLPSLYRYVVGSYVFHGYREGLNEFGQIHNVGDPIGLP